jgi:hypothetical protein
VSEQLEWLRPLIPILGVAVGFVLGQWDYWRRTRREAKGARILVRLEIEDNLAEVRRYRAEAGTRALDEMLPPAWQREAWVTQLSRLPVALSLLELARVRLLYQRLDLVAEHHQRARAAAKDPEVQAREVEAVEALTRALVGSGNPLSPRHRSRQPQRWPPYRRWLWTRQDPPEVTAHGSGLPAGTKSGRRVGVLVFDSWRQWLIRRR